MKSAWGDDYCVSPSNSVCFELYFCENSRPVCVNTDSNSQHHRLVFVFVVIIQTHLCSVCGLHRPRGFIDSHSASYNYCRGNLYPPGRWCVECYPQVCLMKLSNTSSVTNTVKFIMLLWNWCHCYTLDLIIIVFIYYPPCLKSCSKHPGAVQHLWYLLVVYFLLKIQKKLLCVLFRLVFYWLIDWFS